MKRVHTTEADTRREDGQAPEALPDVALSLHNDLDPTLQTVVRKLFALGAPVDSFIESLDECIGKIIEAL